MTSSESKTSNKNEIKKSKGRRAKKLGLSPGTLVATSDKKRGKTVLTVIDYDPDRIEEKVLEKASDTFSYKERASISWINIDGVYDPEVIQTIGTHYDLHPLTLEDVLNTDQRPRIENMGHYIYIVLRMLYFSNENKDIASEQVSIVIGKQFLLTFQEEERTGDCFNFVRERLRNNRGRLRKLGTDYLAYALIDAIVDYYFVILEELGERIEKLEKQLISDPSSEILSELYSLKRSMLSLRRSVWPLRELLHGFEQEESELISESTSVYLKDVYSHAVQIIDNIEILRETLASMLEIYLSSVSYKLNSVMKVLTIAATIFMPLTFISSIYGMNFKYMPELDWHYGYPLSLALMLFVGLGMLVYFRIKRWL
jgi:magnesium transporter